MRIYLAGAFSGWRDNVIANVKNHKLYDPRTDTNQSAIFRFVRGDVLGVENSDMVFAYAEQGQENVGMSWELGIATALKIPIILVTNKKFIFPLHAGIALRIFTCMDTAICYLNNLKNMSNEFEAAYKAMVR